MILWPLKKYKKKVFWVCADFVKSGKCRYTVSLNIIQMHINLVSYFGNNHLMAKENGLSLCSHRIRAQGGGLLVSTWLSYLICFPGSLSNSNNIFLFIVSFIAPLLLSTLWMLCEPGLCLAAHIENLMTVLTKLEFMCTKCKEVWWQSFPI